MELLAQSINIGLNLTINDIVVLSIIIIIETVLLIWAIELARSIIVGYSIKESIERTKKVLPVLIKYHSAFKILNISLLLLSLYLFNQIMKNPMNMVLLLSTITLLIFQLLLLLLTIYPTYKALHNETNTKKLIAYTFSLPSMLFSFVLVLLFIPILFIPFKFIYLSVLFIISWFVYYFSKNLEKIYC